MRYQIGQQVLAMYVNYTRRGPNVNVRMNPNPFPWVDTLDHMKLAVLEVKTHKQVPWDQDPTREPKYDGYTLDVVTSNFVVPQELVFYNQYPSASYGQISTDQDWRFSIGALSRDMVDRRYPTGYVKRILAMEEQLSGIKPFCWHMRDAQDVIRNLDLSIFNLYESKDKEMHNRANMLAVYREELLRIFKEQLGFIHTLRDLLNNPSNPYMVVDLERTAEVQPSKTSQELAEEVQKVLDIKRREYGYALA